MPPTHPASAHRSGHRPTRVTNTPRVFVTVFVTVIARFYLFFEK